MTQDQLNQIRKEYPRETEMSIDDMYQWTTAALVKDLLRWMPKSEFMKHVYQWEKDIKNED